MKYFFNLIAPWGVIDDREGIVLPLLTPALLKGVVRDVVVEEDLVEIADKLEIEVVDDSGRVVMTLQLNDLSAGERVQAS